MAQTNDLYLRITSYSDERFTQLASARRLDGQSVIGYFTRCAGCYAVAGTSTMVSGTCGKQISLLDSAPILFRALAIHPGKPERSNKSYRVLHVQVASIYHIVRIQHHATTAGWVNKCPLLSLAFCKTIHADDFFPSLFNLKEFFRSVRAL
jgi:hypothetical protein